MGRNGIAFFDVDETLVTVKSMFSFLACALPDDHRSVEENLRRLAAAGVAREETNRLYYRAYRGLREADLAEAGRDWFARQLAIGGLFHTAVVQQLRRHQAGGFSIALVSGSFNACLDPIAEHLGADHVLCSVPQVVDGRYTGEVLSTVIGEGKALAARALMSELGVSAEDCVAYGDHASDLPMLLAVAAAGIVGDDPVLRTHASRYGWTRLPAIAAPAMTTKGTERATG